MRTQRSIMAFAFLLAVVLLPAPAAAQSGSVTGVVRDRATQRPLSGVQVYLIGTTLGQITNTEGRYLILNVPARTYSVATQFLGYAESRQNDVVVQAGQSATANFDLAETVLTLEEVTVSGSTDPIAGVKAPFSVGKIGRENIATVPTVNSAVASIQGKIAGAQIVRGTGQPGEGVSVLLRTPTVINTGANGEPSNSPMFVVDGVILADIGGTTIDLESMDIESIEVVKGASAASLYGSRAAAGVISITTSRGRNLQLDQTRITVRSEYGLEEAPTDMPLSRSHQFLQNAQGDWIDANGNVVSRTLRVVDADNIMDNPFVNPVYDNINSYFQPGLFTTNTVNLSYFGQSTNFLTSGSLYRQRGPLEGNDGFTRMNFRVNLDHRLRDDFSLSVSAAHSRYRQDGISDNPGAEGGIFWDLLLVPADVDLSRRDSRGQLLQQPDSTLLLTNPLWTEATRNETEWRVRTLASVDARFNPFAWLNLAGNVAYDRSDQQFEFYIPKGTPTSLTADIPSDGRLDKDFDYTDGINASLTSNILWNFGGLTTRTTLRGIMEREHTITVDTRGDDFWVIDVPDLGTAATRDLESTDQEIRSSGYFIEESLDYNGKYIGSFLARRDGSSLFGPEARWQNYYRAAGSWRMSQESWWPFERLNEFKLRASVGTAGGRPSFAAQYETWTVNENGAVTKNTLGNRDLRPSHTTEMEFGVDLIALDRYSLELTYARQKTRDQIIALALPAMAGYPTQWFNTGVQSGHTYEATFQAQVVNGSRFSWNTTLVADRSRSRIDEWNRSCFLSGLQNICDDVSLSDIWGSRILTSVDEVRARHPDAADQFQVNDDGYVVWVGPGNSWREGLSKSLWGTAGSVDGRTYNWGIPVFDVDDQNVQVIQRIGSSAPDFNVGWLNNVTWRGLAIHTHMHAQIGGNVYNGTRQRLYQHERHGDLDQSAKQAENKKTIAYYQAVYNANDNTTHFVEPGSYLKLRAISAQYRFNRDQLQKVGLGSLASQISVGLIGRNMFTLTGYSGLDPEVGNVLERRDTFAYPNGRQYTATIEITF